MLLKIGVLVLALAVAVQAYGNGEGSRRGGYRNKNARLIKVKNIWEPTIVEPTQKHYSKKVSASKSRRDKWEEVNTRTQTNIGQKIVTSDEYVKDNVHVEYPLKVVNVEHHNNHLTVKNVYPKHINTRVNRWKTVIKPQEGRTDSYSNSESRKKIVHQTEVQNRQKSVNLGTRVEPTQWVDVQKGYNGSRGQGYNSNRGKGNNGYRGGQQQENWEEDK